MLFDDRLATVLDGPVPTGSAARIQYAQLVDILAQRSHTLSVLQLAAGLSRIHQLRHIVDENDRVKAIENILGRLESAPLVQYLAADTPSVASAAIKAARLADQTWAQLIPDFSVRARGFLRSRKDIGRLTSQTLARYGMTDMALTSSVDEKAIKAPTGQRTANETFPSQEAALNGNIGGREIGKIVAKIEALRKTRSTYEHAQLPLGDEYLIVKPPLLDRFAFETDESGEIIWTNYEPAGAINGTNISRAAHKDGSGPDGYAAAAFRQRMPIEGARLQLRGAAEITGGWRVDAQPYFEKATGRFCGFRGNIRRPNTGESTDILYGGQRSDSVRQLVHELRTPLNAIQGFAEIIEQQLFGPVAYEYRSLAREIMKDANFMLSGFEDLDTAMMLDRDVVETDKGHTDVAWLSARIDDRLGTSSPDSLDQRLIYKFSNDFDGFGLDHATSERMIMRLLSTLVTSAAPGETLYAAFHGRANMQSALMLVTLPSYMSGRSEEELCSPDFAADQDGNAPSLLGVGFSLRLVRNLVRKTKGEMDFRANTICVTLPCGNNRPDNLFEAVAD